MKNLQTLTKKEILILSELFSKKKYDLNDPLEALVYAANNLIQTSKMAHENYLKNKS